MASPAELAFELEAPLGVVAYHVRRLREFGCVELVRTEPRRGALQHFYKATARANFDGHQWRALPSSLRSELARETLQELIFDLAAAADAGTLGDPALVLSRATLELDARGWKKLNKLLARTHQQAIAIATESAARGSDGEAQRVFATELGVLSFKRDVEAKV